MATNVSSCGMLSLPLHPGKPQQTASSCRSNFSQPHDIRKSDRLGRKTSGILKLVSVIGIAPDVHKCVDLRDRPIPIVEGRMEVRLTLAKFDDVYLCKSFGAPASAGSQVVILPQLSWPAASSHKAGCQKSTPLFSARGHKRSPGTLPRSKQKRTARVQDNTLVQSLLVDNPGH